MMHRAEPRPTHAAELRALEVLGGQRLVVIFLRSLRIECEPELLLPVECVTRARQRIIAIARSFATSRNIGRMRSDLVRYDSFTNIIGIRQSEMFLRCDIAQHVGAVPPDQCGTNCARDVVVTR